MKGSVDAIVSDVRASAGSGHGAPDFHRVKTIEGPNHHRETERAIATTSSPT